MTSSLVVLGSIIILILLLNDNIRYGVFWTLFCLPLYELGRIHLGPLSTTVVELMILLLFGWRLIKQRAVNQSSAVQNIIRYPLSIIRSLGPWSWLIPLWIMTSTFSMILSPNLREAAGAWKAFFIEPILFFIVFVDVMMNESPSSPLAKGRAVEGTLNALIASGTLVALIAIIQRFTGWWIENPFWAEESTRRVTSVFPFPNAVGLYLAPIAILALAKTMSHLPRIRNPLSWTMRTPTDISPRLQGESGGDGFQKIVSPLSAVCSLSAFLMMFFAIFFARSRGALVGVVSGVVALAFIHKGKRAWYWLGTSAIIGAILISGQTSAVTRWFLNQPTSFAGGDSILIRLEQGKETLKFIADNPLHGAGIAGFQTRIAPYHRNPDVEIYHYPHNIFLAVWTELGLTGLLVFILLIGVFSLTTMKSIQRQSEQESRGGICDRHGSHFLIRDSGAAVLAAMTTLLVHGLVDVPYFKNDLSVLFWILIGISIIMRQDHDRGRLKLTTIVTHDS